MSAGVRRRGAELEDAILDAAAAELAERGWAGFGIEGVSRRCGTAKAVVYRRWRNRVELAQAVLARMTADPYGPHEPAGDLRADLVAFLRGMSRFLAGPFGEAVRGTMFEGEPDERSSALEGPVIVRRVGQILDEARARGDLDHSPSAAAANLGHAMAMSEFLHTGRPPSEEAIAILVDELWLPALEHRLGAATPPVGAARSQ